MKTRLLLPLMLLSGCALDSGEGFAVLEPTVQARYAPTQDRQTGDGFQRLSSDFQVRLDNAALGVSHVELLGGAGTSGPTTFDPANPPPGYSLCHNGHCHRSDGALVDYADIEAELNGGGGSGASLVAALHVDGELDLVSSEPVAVECEPDCELPRTTLTRGVWEVTTVKLEGQVRDARVPARILARAFRLSLTSTGGGGGHEEEALFTVTGAVDVPSDREHEPRVKLALSLPVPSSIFDAVDWSTVVVDADGVADLGDSRNEAARKGVLDALADLTPQAEVRRENR
ncbi:hypothetical protein LZ198_20935 [Myxococcus sp. K15C18031901]|uniref:hypothetical protein n=1 Tax=Myxococcus dinghuensis TaxID=2906761 RepID=UPI0020A7E9EC|nr:hypothetical protein [Myxococcus dinghuensis]MCP3101343.1 hypothetical protein [Myxococcus dinghuensis]